MFQLLNEIERGLSTEINDTTAESAEQDQTARMYRLILLYTLRKIITPFANGRIRNKNPVSIYGLTITVQGVNSFT